MDQVSYHLEVLRTELGNRMRANPHYSLRSFARDLKVQPSWLSEFLRAKKGLSLSRAEELVQRLNLNDVEKSIFLLSVSKVHSRSSKQRKLADSELRSLLANKNTSKKISSSDHKRISQWYHLAILELIELDDCDHSLKWLSHKLQLPLRLVQMACDELVEFGLLEIVDKKMRATFNQSETTSDVPSSSIRDYHNQVMQKASVALSRQQLAEREFLNMTLAFDTNMLPEVKEYLRNFQKKFAQKFYKPQDKKNSVYQLSIHFFRMDEK